MLKRTPTRWALISGMPEVWASRLRRGPTVAGSLGLISILVLNSVMLGLRVTQSERPPFLSPAELDYSRGPLGPLTPLRDFFIERILGRRIPEQPDKPSSVARASQSLSKKPSSGAVAPVVVDHPLTHDSFTSAYPISSLPFIAKTNTRGAGRESGEPSDCTPVGGTVWYRYVASEKVGLIADTSGTNRPVSLSVFSGRDLPDLDEVECSTHPRGNSRVAFAAVRGQTYYFQVASVSEGNLVFSARVQGFTNRPAFADDFAGFGSFLALDGRYMTFWGFQSPTGRPSDSCRGAVHGAAPVPNTLCRAQSYVFDMNTERVAMVSVSSKGLPKIGRDARTFAKFG